MNSNGLMTVFNMIAEGIMRFAGANLLWIIFNLPMIIVGLKLLTIENPGGLFQVMTVLLILTPFIFFPATSALFGLVRKYKLRQDISIVKTFWNMYRENYLKSMIGGFIIVILGTVVIVDYYMIVSITNFTLQALFILLVSLILVIILNFFSLVVHIELKTISILKQACLITFARPFQTIQIAIVAWGIIFVSFNIFTFLIPFFFGSLIAYHSFHVFMKAYSKATSQQLTKRVDS
ncbi:YesL family protein [Metabacillus halosaccharovorans]|uniref:YesL family protein n=1 Tax=Metabacillus halosaccharovorans TaxID=930124 RepID=UPI00203FC5A8|nr:DUF624 domain-containing protein [Metabacillus halosaccharovorans]MCM3443669.1 DUF624 domain-containing protein [Metabacillus halosaccharovorans]